MAKHNEHRKYQYLGFVNVHAPFPGQPKQKTHIETDKQTKKLLSGRNMNKKPGGKMDFKKNCNSGLAFRFLVYYIYIDRLQPASIIVGIH